MSSLRMRGNITPLRHMPSWRGAQAQGQRHLCMGVKLGHSDYGEECRLKS